MIDRTEILRQLDSEAEAYVFPMLDNGYSFHGDQKMTIFRDEKRWAILIEVLDYFNREQGLDGISSTSAIFGNCLIGWGDRFKYFASDNDAPAFLYEEGTGIEYLNDEAKSINIRNTVVPIIFDKEHYKLKGIEFEYEDKITPWEFMRGLIPEYSHLFWLTREEISDKIPKDLPVFMTLHNWHHPDLAIEEKPSDKETFQQLADAILTGDVSLYNPTEMVNTHWSNWPEGGRC
ncbi:DUF7003 family protein [Emticicia soli]|uniref:DUF7003 family protein n=1 Tax=Emticicia soli TaxID=2027878 RepID=A0ABW5JA27_9BACT